MVLAKAEYLWDTPNVGYVNKQLTSGRHLQWACSVLFTPFLICWQLSHLF